MKQPLRVLVVDIGGTGVKLLATGETERRRFPSGKDLTPTKMVAEVKKLAKGWKYDAVSIGYPGPVREGVPALEPRNLGRGWLGFDFQAAFGCPVKVLNDAAMQALGSYKRGVMLFLGFGTSLGAAVVAEGVVVPMELAHLSFKDGTYQDYVGDGALRRLGRKKWQKYVEYGAARMIEAVGPDDVVIGGGNVKKLKKLPKGCRAGANAYAFVGGYRLWGAAR